MAASRRTAAASSSCSASSCVVAQPRVGGHQAHLVEREPRLDADRERARDDLQVQLAVVAGGDLVEAVAAVGEHTREHVQAPGRALRVGLGADARRAGAAPRSAGPGTGGRAPAWRRRAGRYVRTRGPRSSARPSSRCRAGSCSAAPTRARRDAGRRSPAAPTRAGIRHGSATIHSRATASRNRWAGSTPAATAGAAAGFSPWTLETGVVLTSGLACTWTVKCMGKPCRSRRRGWRGSDMRNYSVLRG